MKRLSLLFIALMVTGAVIAQVPQAINYQAVARNNAGQALATQTIKVRLTVNRNAVSQYSETRQLTTNGLGLFNVQIGSSGALVTTGSFTGIDWSTNTQPLMLKVELDINNSGTFTDMGQQSFASVPYSFTAEEAIDSKKIGGNAVATTTPATGDLLRWNGTAWAPAAVSAAQIYPLAIKGATIPAAGTGASPWVAGYTALPTVTLVAGQKLIASFTATINKLTSSGNPVAIDICYQDISGGTIYNIGSGDYSDVAMPSAQTSYVPIAASAGATVVAGATLGTQNVIPPGTYRIFVGFKNRAAVGTPGSITVQYVNGFIQVF
jgi:hypothetical protein